MNFKGVFFAAAAAPSPAEINDDETFFFSSYALNNLGRR